MTLAEDMVSSEESRGRRGQMRETRKRSVCPEAEALDMKRDAPSEERWLAPVRWWDRMDRYGKTHIGHDSTLDSC